MSKISLLQWKQFAGHNEMHDFINVDRITNYMFQISEAKEQLSGSRDVSRVFNHRSNQVIRGQVYIRSHLGISKPDGLGSPLITP